jgi:DNA polymerase I-like protein with 3'-5' exonuclease and polymerase domains
LNLDKQIRSIVKPSNDFFLELDFNAAELRTLLSLSGEEQPDEDIHDWNMKNILTSCKTREEAKKMVFSWLYDENKINRALGRRYKRTATIKDYWKDNVVQTCFGREMKAERKLALNYILQSTTADMVLRQTVKVNDILKGKRSHIAFLMHDSVVIDMSRLDTGSILEMVETFSDTKLGKYKVNVKAGKDFGNLKDLVL